MSAASNGPAGPGRAGPDITLDTSAVSPDSQPNPAMSAVSEASNPATLSTSDNLTSSNLLAVPGNRPRGGSDASIASHRSIVSDQVAVPAEKLHSTEEMRDDPNALTPDPGTEADFVVANNVFAYTPGLLSRMYNPKNYGAFFQLGGPVGIAHGLRTDLVNGLDVTEGKLSATVSLEESIAVARESAGLAPTGASSKAETVASAAVPAATPPRRQDTAATSASQRAWADRKRVFGGNRLPDRPTKPFYKLVLEAWKDVIMIILTVAAVISLGLGLYETFAPPEPHSQPAGEKPGVEEPADQPPVKWVEGVAIIVAIVIVILVASINDWQKERQFVRLNRKKEDRTIRVIRAGVVAEISVHDVVVGDLVKIEGGDIIPVDGIFLSGSGVKCDESSATGESDIIGKTPSDQVYLDLAQGNDLTKRDPFIISGARVTEGDGIFLCTAVGVNSSYGKIMMSLHEEDDSTPMKKKLDRTAKTIAKFGMGFALLLVVILGIKWAVALPRNHGTPAQKATEFMHIVIVGITVVVVAVPEGLPLAVTLALAFATVRMLADNNLVRKLHSCEIMGNATTVCSDKTGTLTQNAMTVVTGRVCTETFDIRGASAEASAADSVPSKMGAFCATLSESVRRLVFESIVFNSTAFERTAEDGTVEFVGSKTETAMLSFAANSMCAPGHQFNLVGDRQVEKRLQLIPFDSGRKCSGVVVPVGSGARLYVKGASEILLAKCARLVSDVADPAELPKHSAMSDKSRRNLEASIEKYAEASLRTIALVYKDFPAWPPAECTLLEGSTTEVEFSQIFDDMVFLGLVGIQDPLRPGVKEAVADFKAAGVTVRMVTGDNLVTARAIARECGIVTSDDDLVLEGPVFRRMPESEMRRKVPFLRVLARSSPEDKRILVNLLKSMGGIVAATGDGTNDAPALKAADVGFSMGIAGTEVAKEASDIILMDDNFSSIVKALLWGRAVNDAVRKFIQFQLTVNITAVMVTMVTSIASESEDSVLTAVQLLWVNLIMDTLAALALATDPPTRKLLNRKPDSKKSSLVTPTMYKMILLQAVFQLAVVFTLHFAGARILNYTDSKEDAKQLKTLVFNTFVWLQIFGQLNSRQITNSLNIFEGILHNRWFLIINAGMIGAQIGIVFVGGSAFGVAPLDAPLNAKGWIVSIIIGSLTLPIGAIIRLWTIDTWRIFTPKVKTADEEVLASDQALPQVLAQHIQTPRTSRMDRIKDRVRAPPQDPNAAFALGALVSSSLAFPADSTATGVVAPAESKKQ